MYFETVLMLAVIGAYYVAEGRRFVSLDRIAEPIFAVNVLYLLNFPVRALVVLFFGDAMESAPALVWDWGTCNVVLLYATGCVLVFNFSYQYFSGARVFPAAPAAPALPPVQQIPLPTLVYFALWAAAVLYFVLTSRTAVNFVNKVGESDIPQMIYVAWFALDAAICGSLLMLLLTRRPVYLAAFALFFGAFLYYSFLLTAKYALVGYLAVILLIMRRQGLAIRPWHLLAGVLVAAPYVIASYGVRDFDLNVISPEDRLATRVSLVLSLLQESSIGAIFTDQFLAKITDRLVYLDVFMAYLQALDQNVVLDLYDKFGSLPTYKLAIPSMFGVDKGAIENIHVWFANKYWYGQPFGGYSVIIPFGRVTESFMILGWAGFLLFALYGWVFAWLYRRFYGSPDPARVIYYLLIFYYYILVDDNLLFNISGIVWGSVFFWASVWALRTFLERTSTGTHRPQGELIVPSQKR